MKIGHIFFSFLLVFALNESGLAQTTNEMNVTISNATTSNGTWSGGTTGPYIFTPSSTTTAANILYTDIQNRLLGSGLTAGNVTIVTAHTGGTQPGNVTFSQAITAATTSTTQHTFTVTAGGNITIPIGSTIDLTPATSSGNNAGRPATNVLLSAGTNVEITAAITTTGGNGHGSGSGGAAGNISITGPSGITLSGNLTADGGTGHSIGSDGDYTINDGATTVTTGGGANDGQTAGIIDGDQLTKTGSGTFFMSGLNVNTGLNTISAGTIQIGANNTFGSGGILISGNAVLDLNGINYSTADALTINGTGISGNGAIINSSSSTATYAGLLTLGSSSTITADNGPIIISNTGGTITGSTFGLTLNGAGTSGVSQIASKIGTGSGTLTKGDGGTWLLSGANTYTGTTTISAGTLQLGADGALGTTAGGTSITSGAVLDLNGVTYSTAEPLTTNGTIINSASGAAAFAGAITLGSASTVTSNNGIITLSGTIATAGNTLTLNGSTTAYPTNNITGIISGTGGIIKSGASVWRLSALNTFSGTASVTAGTLVYGTSSGTTSGSPSGPLGGIAGGTTIGAGSALDLSGNSQTGAEPVSLNGMGPQSYTGGSLVNTGGTPVTFSAPITLAGSTGINASTGSAITVSGNISATTGTGYSLTLGGAGGGTVSGVIGTSLGSLIKTDGGTWTLSGTNTYTGTTTISAGTLALGKTGAISSSSSVDMDGGTFSTGASTGFTETAGTLNLTNTSTIALGTGSHTLTFAASNGVSWVSSDTLLITGWVGSWNGTTGTSGKIFVGGSPGNGLTATQVAQIYFVDQYGNDISAKILTTGEVVPVGKAYYAKANTAWNVNSTWTYTSNGTISATDYPNAGDVVFIGEGTTNHTVSIPSGYAAACASLTMGTTTDNTVATLNFTDNTSSLTVSSNLTMMRALSTTTSVIGLGAGTLKVGGNLDLSYHTSSSTATDRIDKITISTGTLTVSGDLIFDAEVAQQSQIVFSGAGTMNLAGNFTLTTGTGFGTLTPSTSTINFDGGSVAQTIPIGVSSITYNNLYVNDTAGAILSAAVTSTNVAGDTKVQSGSLDNGGFAIGGGSGNTFEVDNGATFFLSGTTSAFPTGFTTYTLGASSTVNYDGTGAQTGAAETYGNLTIAQSGTRTVTLANSGTIGIAGAFTPDVTTTSYTVTGSTVNFNGTVPQTIPAFSYNNLTISGAYTTNSVTLASSGIIGIAGTFTPSATFTSGGYINTGSTVDFNSTGSQTISAFSYNNLTNSGNGARTLASSGTIGVAGTFTPSTGTNTITGSTVDFNGISAQTVPAFNFNNLNISGSRTGNSVTLVNGGTIGIAGNFNANTTFSSGSFIVTNNTVNFNGTAAQAIGGTGLPAFNILNISNTTSPTSVMVNSNTGAAALNFTSSPTVLSIASSVTLTVSGTFTLNNSATAGVTGTVTGAGALSVGAVAIGNNTTPISSVSTTKLTSTINTFSVTGNITLNGYYTSASILNNPVFDLQSGTLTVGGVITIINANGNNVATFTTQNGAASGFIVLQNAAPFSITGGANTIALNGNNTTVDYHGSTLQSVYAGTYNNVNITNAANAELTGATTISGVLTFNSGNLVTNSQSLTLNGTVAGSSSSSGISGDASASLSIGGSGSMGTIYFASAGQQVANLTMNRTSTGNVIFGTNLTVSSTLTLTSGYITTGSNAVTVSNAAASAIVAGGSNTTFTLGWINGNLNRSYTSGTDGTYTFPVGNSSAGHLASIATHSLVGTGSFSADFIPVHDGNNSQVDAFETGLPGTYKTAYTSMNPGGFWDITGFTPTGGNYDVQLYLNGLSGLVDNQFAELKRPIGSTTYADFKPDAGTLNGTSGLGRLVSNGYTLRMGLTTFSEFGIGQAATVLPIQLVSFTAQKAPNGTDVILNWNTASELDNDHFEVEVATQVTNDGLTFITLGDVAGNGTSEVAHSYSFTDNRPDKSGVRYYRLKQVNTDGSFTYTDVVSVTFDAATLQSVNVYPNPVSDVLYYSFNAPQQGDLTITVTNLLGQPIYSQMQSVTQGSNTLQLNVNQLTQGIYLVNITNDNGLVSQRKIEKL